MAAKVDSRHAIVPSLPDWQTSADGRRLIAHTLYDPRSSSHKIRSVAGIWYRYPQAITAYK